MQKMRVDLAFLMTGPFYHLSIVHTGFKMLHDAGIIDLHITAEHKNKNINTAMAIATINNDTCILYDMIDGYNLQGIDYDSILDNVEFCFKRSYSKDLIISYRNKGKIYPYGICFPVYYKAPIIDFSYGLKESVKRVINTFRGYSQKTFTPRFFAAQPSYKFGDDPKIIFCTRLWDPDEIDPQRDPDGTVREQRNIINAMRIDIIKNLTARFGENFFGGIENNSYAQQYAPELIIASEYSIRHNYIETMKKHDICIASTGLHNSIGFKFGEYMAASKAIVTEKLHYSLPGNFMKNEHYLSYTSTDECIRAVEYLCKNPDKLQRMQYKNWIYYHQYARPDIQVLNTLIHAFRVLYCTEK